MQELQLNFDVDSDAKRGGLAATTAKKPRKKSAYANKISKSNGLITLSRGVGDTTNLIDGVNMTENWQDSK